MPSETTARAHPSPAKRCVSSSENCATAVVWRATAERRYQPRRSADCRLSRGGPTVGPTVDDLTPSCNFEQRRNRAQLVSWQAHAPENKERALESQSRIVKPVAIVSFVDTWMIDRGISLDLTDSHSAVFPRRPFTK